MPKRKRRSDDFEKIRRKIKKLERDLYRVRSESDDSSNPMDYKDYSDNSDTNPIRYYSENSLDADIYGDEVYPPPDNTENNDTGAPTPTLAPDPAPILAPNMTPADAHTSAFSLAPAAASSNLTETAVEENSIQGATTALDSSILEILGADPTASIEYGKEIHTELASRLEHIATMGLSKDARKELSEKYLVPANCTKIGSPLLNAEIKAAVTDVVTKRDKGIETRQKQLAGAIAGLAGIMSKELDSGEKDSERLKQLMDVCRILCDVQHNESITRRNFAIFSIKRDLKDHIVNTTIDKYLFGENLAEALKTAKAVSKSGSDLKVKSQVNVVKPSTSAAGNLNWKARVPARRQQGPRRNREPAHRATPPGPSTRYTRAPPLHGNSSKTSQPPQRQYRRQ